MTDRTPRRSRRTFLGALTAGAVALAGCTGDETDDQDDTDDHDDPGADTDDADADDGATDADDADIDDDADDPGEAPADPPTLGDEAAPVTLEVYTDFACPACAAYDAAFFDDMIADYVDPGDVRYEHRDFVLPVDDPGSWEAANAAREVHRQDPDTFWEFKTVLLERQQEIRDGPERLGEIAAEVGADGDLVEAAAADRSHEAVVQEDTERAESVGVPGTPGFVVDGEAVVEDVDTVEQLVDAVRERLDEALADG